MPFHLAAGFEVAMNLPATVRLVKLGKKAAAGQTVPSQPASNPW